MRRRRRAPLGPGRARVVGAHLGGGDEEGEGHLVAVALDARLFGRLRLLTLDAVLDVAPRRAAPGPVRRPSPAGPPVERRRLPAGGPRRAEAEHLLRDARAVLAGAPGPGADPP